MAQTTLTAPIASIWIGGKPVGKIRNIRVTENVTRVAVTGVGVMTVQELPATMISCSFQASSYTIDMYKLGDSQNTFLYRNVASLKQLIDTLGLAEVGVDIYLYRKVPGTIENGVVTSTEDVTIGVIRNAYIESQSFDLSEGQISGSDISGRYTEPIMSPQA